MTYSVHTKSVLCLIFLGLLAQVGCRGNLASPETSTVATPVLPTHVSQAATITPSLDIQPTRLLPPTGTPSPTPTTSPSPTVTPSPTVQTTPTLEAEESYKYVMNLFKTNGGCALPCIIGITPGKTSWGEAQAMFAFLGKEPPKPEIIDDYRVKYYDYQYLQEGQPTMAGFSFYVKDDVITLMSMGIHTITDPDIEKQYAIKTVLSTLGKPKEVLFYLDGYGAEGPEDITPFVIKLFYNDERTWLIAKYYGIALMKGDVLRFCTADLRQGVVGRVENDVGLLIQPVPNFYSPNDIHRMGGGGDPILSGKSFEEATGEDVASFFEKVIGPGEDACFTTPKGIW